MSSSSRELIVSTASDGQLDGEDGWGGDNDRLCRRGTGHRTTHPSVLKARHGLRRERNDQAFVIDAPPPHRCEPRVIVVVAVVLARDNGEDDPPRGRGRRSRG